MVAEMKSIAVRARLRRDLPRLQAIAEEFKTRGFTEHPILLKGMKKPLGPLLDGGSAGKEKVLYKGRVYVVRKSGNEQFIQSKVHGKVPLAKVRAWCRRSANKK